MTNNGQPRELFLSSDANAIVEHTKKALMIEDGEVVHLKVLFSFRLSIKTGWYISCWNNNMRSYNFEGTNGYRSCHFKILRTTSRGHNSDS